MGYISIYDSFILFLFFYGLWGLMIHFLGLNTTQLLTHFLNIMISSF